MKGKELEKIETRVEYPISSSSSSASSSSSSSLSTPGDKEYSEAAYNKSILLKFQYLNTSQLHEIQEIMKTNGDNSIAAYVEWEKGNHVVVAGDNSLYSTEA